MHTKIFSFLIASLSLGPSACASGSRSAASNEFATPARRFSETIYAALERRELELPRSGDAADEVAIRAALAGPEGKRLVELYRANLPAGFKARSFEPEALAADLALPTAHPVGMLTNRTLIWAVDSEGKRAFAFRPIDTTTGCDSSCTPVVFHLVLDAKGKTIDLIEEKSRPLRKAYHQVFSTADRKKAVELAQQLPKALRTVSGPKSLVDWDERFPPRTWTFFSGFIAKEAAFTSWRIFEAALTSHRAIAETVSARADARYLTDDAVGEYLRVTDFSGARKQAQKAIAALNDSRTPATLAAIHARMLPYLIGWMGENGSKDIGLVREIFSLPQYHGANLAEYCVFNRDLVSTKNGRELYLKLSSEWKNRPVCGDKLEKFLRVYVKTLENPSAMHTGELHDFDLTSLPLFVRNRPAMLLDIARALPERAALRLRIVALVEAYYPRVFDRPEASTLVADRARLSQELRDEIKRDRLSELGRKFLHEKIALPPVPLKSQSEKSLGSTALARLPEGSIVVFFASWCPHCQETVKRLVEARLSEANWKRISLVEIFPRSNTDLKDFCAVAKLTNARCGEIRRIDMSKPAAERFLDALGVTSVPRAVLLGKNATILVSDLDLALRPHSDADQEFSLLFEAAAAFKTSL